LHCISGASCFLDRAIHRAGLFVSGLYSLAQSLSLPAKNPELKCKDKGLDGCDIDKRIVHWRGFADQNSQLQSAKRGNTSFYVFQALFNIVYKPLYAKTQLFSRQEICACQTATSADNLTENKAHCWSRYEDPKQADK
jgi:hypothetical protein